MKALLHIYTDADPIKVTQNGEHGALNIEVRSQANSIGAGVVGPNIVSGVGVGANYDGTTALNGEEGTGTLVSERRGAFSTQDELVFN